MALRKVPANLSFVKIREKHAPKGGMFDDATNSESANVLAVTKIETNEPPATVETSSETRPGSQPIASAAKTRSRMDRASMQSREVRPKAEDEPGGGATAIKASNVVPNSTSEMATPITDEIESKVKVRMKIRVPYPAKGVSRTFDEHRIIYGERLAFKAILDAALSDYETALLDGAVAGPTPTYAPARSGVQTTRLMTERAYIKARLKLDPAGILGSSTFGAIVVKNALSRYFAKAG